MDVRNGSQPDVRQIGVSGYDVRYRPSAGALAIASRGRKVSEPAWAAGPPAASLASPAYTRTGQRLADRTWDLMIPSASLRTRGSLILALRALLMAME